MRKKQLFFISLMIFVVSLVVYAAAPIVEFGKIYVRDNSSANKIGVTAPTLSSSYNVVLPTADGTPGQVLTTNGTGQLYFSTGSGGSGSPGGANKNVQFNNSGGFGGSNLFNWDNSVSKFLLGILTSRDDLYNSTVAGSRFQIEGTDYVSSSMQIIRDSSDTVAPFITFGKSRSGSVGGDGLVSVNDSLGAISFQGNDGTNLQEGARIDAQVSATAGSADMPASLRFMTTSDSGIAASERMRIDHAGKILAGIGVSRDDLFGASVAGSKLQVEGTDYVSSSAQVVRNENSASGPWFTLAKTRGGSVGSDGLVALNDFVGSISFQGNDGTNNLEAARIEAQINATPGTNDMPGSLIFKTTADGASSAVEHMRISQAGNVGIDTGVPDAKLDVLGNFMFIHNNKNNNTFKVGRIGSLSYANSNFIPITFNSASGGAGTNDAAITLGGGTGFGYAANDVIFYTAANDTTVTGTERARINRQGTLNINTNALLSPMKLVVQGDGVSAPTHSGTTLPSGSIARFRGSTNAVLDMGSESSTGFWFKSTDATGFNSDYPMRFWGNSFHFSNGSSGLTDEPDIIQVDGGVQVSFGSVKPQSTATGTTGLWGIDFAESTSVPNYISFGNSDSRGLGTGSGMVILHCNSTGEAAMFLTYAGVVNKIGGAASIIASTTPGAAQISLGFDGSTYRVYTGSAAACGIFITTIRTRTAT